MSRERTQCRDMKYIARLLSHLDGQGSISSVFAVFPGLVGWSETLKTRRILLA